MTTSSSIARFCNCVCHNIQVDEQVNIGLKSVREAHVKIVSILEVRIKNGPESEDFFLHDLKFSLQPNEEI